MKPALALDPADDDDALDEETLPIGNAWAPHLLDDDCATELACDRVFSSYLRSSREHGHEDTPLGRELTEAQVHAFRKAVYPKHAAEALTRTAEVPRAPRAPRRPRLGREQVEAKLRLGPLGWSELRIALGAAKAPLCRAINAAIGAGTVERRGKTGSRYATYALVEKLS